MLQNKTFKTCVSGLSQADAVSPLVDSRAGATLSGICKAAYDECVCPMHRGIGWGVAVTAVCAHQALWDSAPSSADGTSQVQPGLCR